MDFVLGIQLYLFLVIDSQIYFCLWYFVIIFFFIDLDTDAFGYKSGPKSLQVLGFTKAKNIQRSFLMDGGSYIFKPNEVISNLMYCFNLQYILLYAHIF